MHIADFRNDEGLRVRRKNTSPTLASSKHSETDISTMPPLIIRKVINNKERVTERNDGIVFTSGGGGRNFGHNQAIIMNNILQQKTRDVGLALEQAKILSKKHNKPIQLDLWHLKAGEIRPPSTYIPQELDIHRCIQAGEPKELLVDKEKIRRLTPTECERLQGFPDFFTKEGLDENGNLVKWVMQSQLM